MEKNKAKQPAGNFDVTAAVSTCDDRGSLLPRRTGCPSRRDAEKLREYIIDAATELFFKNGYGLTSIEALARSAHISKRTFYDRFDDKAALFTAVVHHIIDRLHPPADVPLVDHGSLYENLLRLSQLILSAALTPQALALHRLIVAESIRFPELAMIASEHGGRQEAITLVAGLLECEARLHQLALNDPIFAAEQFLQMVISLPQRRALGLGKTMTPEEITAWARDSVDLFLNGCLGSAFKREQESDENDAS